MHSRLSDDTDSNAGEPVQESVTLSAEETARRLLNVGSDASPQQVEAAYLQRMAELRVAFLELGGFPRAPAQRALRFDNFVVGESNRDAFNLALSVADGPSSACNPLFIHGSCGVGKTHLLHAIANRVAERRQHLSMCCSGQSFVDEMISSVARGRLPEFREKYRNLDYLMMDDVQMLGGKSRTQEETYTILNQLVACGSQVVLAGRGEPEALEQFGQGLRSRIAQAVPVGILYPELAEREDIVFRKAGELGISLSRPVAYYLARQYTTDVRELEAAVKRVYRHLHGGGRAETQQDLESMLYGTSSKPSSNVTPTVGDIQEAVSRHFNLPIRDIVDGKGSLKVKRARQIAMFLSREVCGCSLENIRRSFRAEASQIAYAQKKIKSASDPGLGEDLRSITEALQSMCQP